jgi:hypothetical protein
VKARAADETTQTPPPTPPSQATGDKTALTPTTAKDTYDIYDVEEHDGRRYMFVGAHYRGNIIPKFILNMFTDGGGTIYTNMIGANFEFRKDGFSIIPALTYHELGTQDMLFHEKNKDDFVGNYSVVNSGLKIIYASVDLLWSTKMNKNWEFEYGAGFGLGTVFGDLQNNWVQVDTANTPGALQGDNGTRYRRCDVVGPVGSGCNRKDHQDSSVDKVGTYTEPSWVNGGSKPNFFPLISVPQVGLRFKPVKNFVGRLGLGFSLTGFWFGLSAQYGLEHKPE